MPGSRGPVPVPVQHGDGDLTLQLLKAVDEHETVKTAETFPNTSQIEIKAALDKLKSRSMIEYDTRDREEVILTEEGEQIVAEGSHEYKVWDAVRQAGKLSLKDPMLATPAAKAGQGKAFKNKWVKKDGDSLVPLTDSVTDTTRDDLQYVADNRSTRKPDDLKDLRKRTLVTTRKVIAYEARKGQKWGLEIPVEVTDLTADMLADGSWEKANFKPYNFKALGEQSQGTGALHPLNKVREEFRKIFFNLGFTEMPTGRYVATTFATRASYNT